MQNTFAILGSGMQGTAAAYDLARFANPAQILVGDVDLTQAAKSADRVNKLVRREICVPYAVNALDPVALATFLEMVDIVISCVPYWMHPHIARVAIDTNTDMVDLGGNTEITLKTLAMDEEAKDAEITIVPDTGLAPGLVNSVGCYIIENLDEVDTVRLFCGVLPQNPQPPFNYKLTFNVEGLVTEYDFEAVVLRDGEVIKVPTLKELESIHIEQLGEMEAFVTSGGTSTAPFTFQGKVKNYEYKTIRFPGHCHLMSIFKDFGFWGEEKIDVKGTSVSPKEVFTTIFGPQLEKYVDEDQCIVRGIGIGRRGGSDVTVQVDIFDRQDRETGFTSMERLTGFSTSIIAQEAAAGNLEKGCLRYENAMSGKAFLSELQRRGIHIVVKETSSHKL
ncbi:MAG: saccharopine dehydrogenase NADP-binding domain-containing protein [Fimbriimonadaceae bacterium]|jgi:lysine 6-dehydrogenase|nr:saccharopine dehydrogenase NADP-binding domain-containing protein [Fimbriimonadaceae bacterium]